MNQLCRNRIKDVSLLQLSILLLSVTGVLAKKAAGVIFLSREFLIYYGIELLVIGAYAVLWQQVLKNFDISVAYSNKGSLIIWTFIWAVLLFNETITLFNIIGAIIIIAGITLVFKNAK